MSASGDMNAGEGPAVPDPFQQRDGEPWAQGTQPTARDVPPSTGVDRPSGFGMQPGVSANMAVTLPQSEAPAQRFVHDVPPAWDGKDPENMVEPYLKSLDGWLSTTRTLREQRGLVMLHYAIGDLKVLINELTIEQLTDPEGGRMARELIATQFKEYIDRKLPKAMEKALFMHDGKRRRDESMVQYTARKRILLNELDRAKCVLPSNAKGYIVLRDAHLSDKAWDMIDTWTQGSYDFETVQTALRKLERPVPGTNRTHLSGFSGFMDSDWDHHAQAPTTDVYFDTGGHGDFESEQPELLFMTESLFILPECFEDEILQEALDCIDDVDILYVSSDLPGMVLLDEDEAVAIYANYSQVRKYLHKKQIGRGYFPAQKLSQGGRGGQIVKYTGGGGKGK